MCWKYNKNIIFMRLWKIINRCKNEIFPHFRYHSIETICPDFIELTATFIGKIFPSIQVACPEITVTKGLSVSGSDRTLNAKVKFGCTNGNGLIGTDEVKCLPSGRWSSPIPACMNIVCPENITGLAKNQLKVHVHRFAAGGIAYFSCGRGNVLQVQIPK